VRLLQRHARRILRETTLEPVEAHIVPIDPGIDRSQEPKHAFCPTQRADPKFNNPPGRRPQDVSVERPLRCRL
jgi:hypothetical protein